VSWIVIPNWEKFQHYGDRDPAWIKLYRSLMANPDFLRLTGHQTGVLVRLWLVYASSNGQLRADSRSLSRQLSLRVSTETLNALKTAGFLRIRASRPLALARARVETEKEKEKDSPKSPQKKKLARVTGWRQVRGSHGITFVPDPFGTDKPPSQMLRDML
jgi:hypothetical protein